MLPKIITALLVIVGMINFLPIIGILSADKLASLYGVTINEPNLLILIRHRALLFGLIGGFIIYAAFRPDLQLLAIIFGAISMLGFILIAQQTGAYNTLIQKIIVIDIGALILLAVATLLFILQAQQR